MRIRRTWVVPAVLLSLVVMVAAAGAAASLETGTVTSFPRGLWWALSLMMTVGFIGPPPTTMAGAILSVVLMLIGFALLALVSAGLASLFVREDSSPFETMERTVDQKILAELARVQDRLTALEAQLTPRAEPVPPASQGTEPPESDSA